MERAHGRHQRHGGVAFAEFGAGAMKGLKRACDQGLGHGWRCLELETGGGATLPTTPRAANGIAAVRADIGTTGKSGFSGMGAAGAPFPMMVYLR
jgi:hypothetical protein